MLGIPSSEAQPAHRARGGSGTGDSASLVGMLLQPEMPRGVKALVCQQTFSGFEIDQTQAQTPSLPLTSVGK